MRSKSRFTTLVLLETRESYLQIRVRLRCTPSRPLSPGPHNVCCQAGANPYSDRSSTGCSAPACLAHSFDHLHASCLVLVRLAHDRRFVGAVLFLLVLVLVFFVFIRISG